MQPRQLVLLLFLLVVGAFYFQEYTPTTYVWNIDPALVRQIAPPLRAVLTMHLLLLGGLGIAGFGALSRPSRRQRWMFLLLLSGGWVLAEQLLQSYLAVEYYAVWKYEFKTEEYSEPVPSVINTDVLALLLHDVRNVAEPVRIRSKLALMLGEARMQAAYPMLAEIVHNARQNPYLRFHCLKSLRRLRPQQFSTVLATVPADSALMLYQKYK
jgi:hypothetical protein